jgi:hypothetical protein
VGRKEKAMDLMAGHHKRSLTQALGAGFAGAAVLTLAHETLRRFRSDAPRMDVVGGRALSAIWRRAGGRPPRGKNLYMATLAADLLSNTAYFAGFLLGRPRFPFVRQTAAGLAAGLGALVLPPILRLGFAPGSYRRKNRFFTIGIYLLGGLVAAAAYRSAAARNLH